MKKFIETCPDKKWEEGLSLHLVDAAKSPRILKSHFPLGLYPEDILDKIKVSVAEYSVSVSLRSCNCSSYLKQIWVFCNFFF